MPVKNKLGVVQVIHPPQQINQIVKRNICNGLVPWNFGKHQRKFLQCEGDYSEYVQKPVRPVGIAHHSGFYNTDPYVFYNDGFIYSNCCQHGSKNQIPYVTQKARMDVGSLILFGSWLKDSNGIYFGIDTVFVVRDYQNFSSGNIVNVRKLIKSSNYFNITPLNRFPIKGILLRCYLGATWNNKVNDMYSFSPCQEYTSKVKHGFERLKLTRTEMHRIERVVGIPNIFCDGTSKKGQKYVPRPKLNISQTKQVWDEIRALSRKQGLLEGVRFQY